jgi:hypothetical protein
MKLNVSHFLLFTFYFSLSTSLAHAETMYSDNFQLRFGNFNMTSGTKTSSGYSLTDTVGQTAAGEFTSSGYTTLAGFQYMYTLYDFSFLISKTELALPTLTIGSFATDDLDLTISTPRQGYTVTTLMSSRLTNGTDFIPVTTCDTSCTTTTAGIWTNTSSYGFGYNLQGQDITIDFSGSTLFRPFADVATAGTPAPIMTSTSPGKNRVATLTAQLAPDPDQEVGQYEAMIYFIATPNY